MEKEHPEKLMDEQAETSRFPSLPSFPELPKFSPPPSFPSLTNLPSFSAPPSFPSLTSLPKKECSTKAADDEATTLLSPLSEPPRARVEKLSPSEQTPRRAFVANPTVPKPRVGQNLFVPPPLPRPPRARVATARQATSEKPVQATEADTIWVVVVVIIFITIVAFATGLICPLLAVGIPAGIVYWIIKANSKPKVATKSPVLHAPRQPKVATTTNVAAMRHNRNSFPSGKAPHGWQALLKQCLLIDSNIWLGKDYDDFFTDLWCFCVEANYRFVLFAPQFDELIALTGLDAKDIRLWFARKSLLRSDTDDEQNAINRVEDFMRVWNANGKFLPTHCAIKRIDTFVKGGFLTIEPLALKAQSDSPAGPLLVRLLLDQIAKGIPCTFVAESEDSCLRARILLASHPQADWTTFVAVS